MTIDFTYPIETNPDQYPAKFLGRDSSDTWNVVTYYVALDDDTVNTGWYQEEVDNDGITRADIEGMVPSPTPFIIQAVQSQDFTLAIYEDTSIVSNFEDPEALPFGEIGRIALTYETEAGNIISATVTEILPKRE